MNRAKARHPTRQAPFAVVSDHSPQARTEVARLDARDPVQRMNHEHRSTWVDLCGLSYYDRRHQLFVALRALGPGEEVELISDTADDVLWLRYELEARMAQRYCWSLPRDGYGTAQTIVRLP